MSARAKKRLRIALAVLAVLVAGWLGSACAVAWLLTHRFHARAAETIPAGSNASEVRLRTSDHEDLGAWWFDGAPDKPVVVLMHGLGGCRSVLMTRVRILQRAGFPLLAVTLRAHGDSSGERIDAGWSARNDVAAAVEWVEQHHSGALIVLDGSSMGAAAAMFAAPALSTRVSGYVLECPYRDLRTAVKNRLECFLPPLLDKVAWAGLRAVSPWFISGMDRIAPIESVGSIPASTPVLILASSADTRARPFEAREIQARVASHAELVFFDGAAHDRLVETHPDQWEKVVTAFLCKIGTAKIGTVTTEMREAGTDESGTHDVGATSR